MDLLLLLWRRAPHRVAAVAFVGVLAGLVNTLLFALMHSHLSHGQARLWRIAVFVGLAVIVIGTNTLPDLLLSPAVRKTMSEECVLLARAIVATPLRRLEEIGRPRILNVFDVDLPAIVTVSARFPIAVSNFTLVLGCLGYLLLLAPLAFAVIAPLLLGGTALHFLSMRSIARFWRPARRSKDAAATNQVEMLAGLVGLQLHGAKRRAFFEHVYEPALNTLRDQNVRLDRQTSLASNLGYSYTWLCLGMALFVVPLLVSDTAASQGALLLVLYSTGLLRFVAVFSSDLASAKLAYGNLNDLLRELQAGEVTQSSGAKSPVAAMPDGHLEIALRGATFTYSRDADDGPPFVVGPFDMTVGSSEVVFVTGSNGSGKTTFAKLLCGLYVPASGDIVWNGRVVDDALREGYRNVFSAIFSEFHVFERLHEHERERERNAADARARQLLETFGLEGKVAVRDGCFTTVNLSTGQRKRLALVVALLEDRPFYLFDEWAADQDPEFREIFYREIIPELARRRKAVVAISHDDRYFHLAHRIVKLADGHVDRETSARNVTTLPGRMG